jgi:hypothetical protein
VALETSAFLCGAVNDNSELHALNFLLQHMLRLWHSSDMSVGANILWEHVFSLWVEGRGSLLLRNVAIH